MNKIKTIDFYKFESPSKGRLEPFIYSQYFYGNAERKKDDISSVEREISHRDKAPVSYRYVLAEEHSIPLFGESQKIVVKETTNDISYELFKERILSSADYREVIPGNRTTVEEIIYDTFSKEQNEIVLNWLNRIFLEASESKAVIANLLFAISHMEYEDVYPVGPTLAMLALNNSNCVLVELAIHAFENWSAKDSLVYLKFYRPKDALNQKDWNRVIKYLEENGD